jgi:hypothetical protein
MASCGVVWGSCPRGVSGYIRRRLWFGFLREMEMEMEMEICRLWVSNGGGMVMCSLRLRSGLRNLLI